MSIIVAISRINIEIPIRKEMQPTLVIIERLGIEDSLAIGIPQPIITIDITTLPPIILLVSL